MLELDAVSLVYDTGGVDFYAVRKVSLRVQQGQFAGLMGPSGSGKSSLLYLLAGLKAPSQGQVRFQGRDLMTMSPTVRSDIRRQHFGFIFQQHFLINYLTVLENVLVGARTVDQAAWRRAAGVLERIGMADQMRKKPPELSGGQKQRVAAARAIVDHPDVIFADEPTAALDHTTGLELIAELERYRDEGGTLVVVTHDPVILKGANRVVRVADGELAGETWPGGLGWP